MTVEMNLNEAELLIAVLKFAEDTAEVMHPAMSAAIADLRTYRSALLEAWLRGKLAAK